MYNVLITDDERAVIDAIISSIDWIDLGVECVLTASNGEEAISIISETPIVLLITDIRMPVMDGLTLVRKTHQVSPETHCILLSAYGEFEYAREAISLGVDNYLLKPLVIDELKQTIKHALNNVYIHRNGRYLAYNNIILRWMLGTISRAELSERATCMGINIYLYEYIVVVIERHQVISLTEFRETCIDTLSQKYTVCACRDEQDRYVVLIGGDKLPAEDIEHLLHSIAHQSMVLEHIHIALGRIVYDMMEVSQSYESACNRLEAASLFSLNSIGNEDKRDIQDEIVHLLMRCQNLKAADKTIIDYIMCISKTFDIAIFRSYMRSCVHALLSEFPNMQKEARDTAINRIKNLEAAITGFDMHTALYRLFEESHLIFIEQFNTLSPFIQLVILYIRDEYSNNHTSIRSFCEKRSINPSYLGRLFKQELGMFFNEYLQNTRLMQAMLLLQDPTLRISDIASQAGFGSSSYFIKCFRQRKNSSPESYRVLQLRPNQSI